MSELKVDKISPKTGTAMTVGDSGDTFTVPSGATLTVAGALNVTGTTSLADGTVAVAELDIDGATDIGEAIVDADLLVIDNGAGGTNRKTAASRIKTYVTGDNSIDSDQYVDGSIDVAHMSANSIDSAQYVDGSIDLAHMSADSIDSTQYVDGSIDTAHLGALQVTGAKLNTDAISAQTALTAEPADTDEFMVSDAGVLKRIDYSLIKGGGALTLLQSVTASSSSTVDFEGQFSTTYYTYMLFFNNVHLSADDDFLGIRIKLSGVGSYHSGASAYGRAQTGTRTNGNNANTDLQTGDADYNRLPLHNGGAEQSGDWTMYGHIKILNANQSDYKMISYQTTCGFQGNNGAENTGMGFLSQNAEIEGIQFLTESGNIASGDFRLYGVALT